MKLNPIIEAISDCHQYATVLQVLSAIAVSPGEPGDIAAMMQAAKRLNDKLAAVQRQVTREIEMIKKSNPKTAMQSSEDIFAILESTK